MQSSTLKRSRIRSGLTLIELLVVLTILIALGGIVVSSFPGLLERTQSATAAANIPEIDSAIRRQMVVANGQVGNRFDSLVTGSTGLNGEIASFVGGAEYFQATPLDESDLQALAQLGITELIPAFSDATDATYESHTQPPVPLGADTKVCVIAEAFAVELLERIWNLTPEENSKYVVLGLGARASIVGGAESALFSEAPVHFSDEANASAKSMYSRYLIVVEIKTAVDQSRARYVGVAIPDRKGLKGISQELQNAFRNSPESN